MNWTMPRPILQWVAAAIGVACLGSFALGVATAPSRGRLPGERLDGATGQPLQAQEATPLTEERIEGAPPPVQLTEEEKAKLEAEKKAKAEATALARAEAENGAPAGPETITPPPATAPPDKIGEVLEKQAPAKPKPEEPLF